MHSFTQATDRQIRLTHIFLSLQMFYSRLGPLKALEKEAYRKQSTSQAYKQLLLLEGLSCLLQKLSFLWGCKWIKAAMNAFTTCRQKGTSFDTTVRALQRIWLLYVSVSILFKPPPPPKEYSSFFPWVLCAKQLFSMLLLQINGWLEVTERQKGNLNSHVTSWMEGTRLLSFWPLVSEGNGWFISCQPVI